MHHRLAGERTLFDIRIGKPVLMVRWGRLDEKSNAGLVAAYFDTRQRRCSV
jgi:hypothetical protein